MRARNLFFSLFMLSLNSCGFVRYHQSKVDLSSHILISVESRPFIGPMPENFYESEVERIRCIAEQDYRSVIKDIKTVEEAAIYCTEILKHGGNDFDLRTYGESDYWASFKRIHEKKIDDCDGGALAAAALLRDDGYPSYILIIKGNYHGNERVHAVFPYRNQEGKYGSIGINKEDIVSPMMDSLEHLSSHIAQEEGLGDLVDYKVFDLGAVFPDFIDNEKNNSLFSWF